MSVYHLHYWHLWRPEEDAQFAATELKTVMSCSVTAMPHHPEKQPLLLIAEPLLQSLSFYPYFREPVLILNLFHIIAVFSLFSLLREDLSWPRLT